MSLAGTGSSTATPRPAAAASVRDSAVRVSARWLLIVLGVSLPFELPLLTVGPLTVTTVELVLYTVLALWSASLMLGGGISGAAADRRRAPPATGRLAAALRWLRRDPVSWTAAVWLAVITVAALAAPSYRVAATKAALRAVGGGLVLFAARDLVRTSSDRRWLVRGIALGSVLSAAGAVAEAALPQTAPLWHVFHGDTFSVVGLPRACGPFAYPTIAAMYWGATLPLVIGLCLSRAATTPSPRGRWRSGWGYAVAGITGAALLTVAVLLSATRTAMVVCALGSVALLACTWHGGARARATTGASVAVVVLLNVLTLVGGSAASPLAMRLRWWQDQNWYGARYLVPTGRLRLEAGSLTAVPISIQNTGGMVWPQGGADPVHLSYHWEITDQDGTHLIFEGRRSPLPRDVRPGETVRVRAALQAPEEPGAYRLRWDLVREHVTWFSQNSTTTGDQQVEVVAGAPGGSRSEDQPDMADASLEDWVSTGIPRRPELWGAALRLWRRHPMLGVGPDNFRHVYPEALPPLGADTPARYDDRVHANSMYLETLADTGLVGLLALALFTSALARTAVRRVRQAAAPPLQVAVPIGLAAFFVHGLLDHFLAFTPTYALMWLLAGLLAAEIVAAPPADPTSAG